MLITILSFVFAFIVDLISRKRHNNAKFIGADACVIIIFGTLVSMVFHLLTIPLTVEFENKISEKEIVATKTDARIEGYKNNHYWSGGVKYPFSSKIYCGEHNTNFQRSHGSRRKNRPTWSCGMYLQYRIKECCSPIIPEVDLYDMFKRKDGTEADYYEVARYKTSNGYFSLSGVMPDNKKTRAYFRV